MIGTLLLIKRSLLFWGKTIQIEKYLDSYFLKGRNANTLLCAFYGILLQLHIFNSFFYFPWDVDVN